ncbi:imidazolonepropionase [Dysgonomonas sp. PH5-45]|uniref:imidazolonepropionase n=1 Tax=unclassified Dysgonomonas TaxID=2630389 RepID=UPI002476A579|nr:MULTISPECIES: imidazolonepropionase [unclassified Dysgonomonas]MDH6354834.1 imidazolonepropionase [Dysgonomonas sp. PH5-45]MDH6387733.1 imidazolonepropionase [Dysgonomonas sp. PH5-37]
MKKGNIIIKNASQVVTCSGKTAKKGVAAMNDLHVIENGTVVVTDGIISFVGNDKDMPALDLSLYRTIDAKGKTVLPGFIDSHTHFVFGGYREEEFSWRMRGDTYMSIMERGGGIHNTMTATRNASFGDLKDTARKRLDKMLTMGVTTVEGKSGYGMNKETELKQLEVMTTLNAEHPVDVVSTFMGAHATPAEYKGKEDEFIDYMIREVMPFVKEKGLAECCDIFCEKNVFDIEQSRRYLTAAKEMGFKLKVHADEIVCIGGAELAAEMGALSADHLLQASDRGIADMRDNDVVATLLPCTAFSLKEHYARGREMIDAGCAVALATDLNPGSSFTCSIPLTFALACIYMKLSPEEAVTALTINAAAAVGRADKVGSIDVGKLGDLAILEFPSYKFLPYHIGMNIVETVVKRGEVVVSPDLNK